MDICPWCGEDATGRDLIPRALRQVQRLLKVTRLDNWGYRVLLRPGVSGVDPRYPKVVEIEQRYVTGVRRRDEVPWSMLVGLISHELGHSFLYHHWHWTRTGAFHRTFGEVAKAYRVVDDAWVDFQRRRVAIAPVNHVSGYATRHPQEDFAETFRFYLTRRGRLRELFAEFGQKRKGVIVYQKFLALHEYVRSLRGAR
jgi:putative zinc-binding metallo-peptidase